jgi:colanic acid/amylovoran biosynthesis glycosyltransferase
VRVALRGWQEKPVDVLDAKEQQSTSYVLRKGASGLLVAVLLKMIGSPLRFVAALGLTLALARRSDRSLMLHLIYLAEACQVSSWLEAQGATHLHAHFGTNSTDVALLASRLSDVPFSFTVHGPEEFDRQAVLNLEIKIAHATNVVAISSFGRSQLYRRVDPSQWPKIRVIHCGLDSAFTEAPLAGILPADTLVCVGRICEQKGQLLLLQALARLKGQGIHCALVLAGDGEMRSTVEAAARQLGVADRLRITGWIDGLQVRKEILEARAMVLPSFAEGLPVAIMEAMALARPVISTFVAGIPELVRPGQEGWLVPAGDVSALAEAMLQCLQAGEDEIRRMGHAARERVLASHDIDVEAGKLLPLFAAGAP